MACYLAPNGAPSKLYTNLKSEFGEKKAEEIYLTTHTDQFTNWFGNFKLRASVLKDLDYNEPRAFVEREKHNMDWFVDENGEPKLFYLEKEGEMTFKSIFEQFDALENKRTMKITDTKYPKFTTNKSKGKGKPFFISSKRIATVKPDQEVGEHNLNTMQVFREGSNSDELYVTSPNVLFETGESFEEMSYYGSKQPVQKTFNRLVEPLTDYVIVEEDKSKRNLVRLSNGAAIFQSHKLDNNAKVLDILAPYIYQYADNNSNAWKLLVNMAETEVMADKIFKATRDMFPVNENFNELDQEVDAVTTFLQLNAEALETGEKTDNLFMSQAQRMYNDIKGKMAINLASETFPGSFTMETPLKKLAGFKASYRPNVDFKKIVPVAKEVVYTDMEKRMIKTGQKQVDKWRKKMEKAVDKFVNKFDRMPEPSEYKSSMALRKTKESLDDAIDRFEDMMKEFEADKRKNTVLGNKAEYQDESVPLSERLKKLQSRVNFNNDKHGIDALTGLPNENHDYSFTGDHPNAGDAIKASASGIIKQYPEYNLNYVDFLSDRIEGAKNTAAYKFFVEQNTASKLVGTDLLNTYIKAIRLNDYKLFSQTLKNFNIEIDEATQSSLENRFLQLRDEIKEWSLRAHIGSNLHLVAESLIKEDEDLTGEDQRIIDYFNGLEDRIKKDEERLIELGELDSLTDEQKKEFNEKRKWIKRFKADINFRNELIKFKNDIRARGGKIITEFRLYHEGLRNFDGQEITTMAGQVDILVVFDEDNTVEIYDWKTIRKKPTKKKPFYTVNKASDKNNALVEFGRENGYDSRRQSKHNFQLQLYAKVLEDQLGIKVRNSYIIPITIPVISTQVQLDKEGNISKYILKDNYSFTRTEKSGHEDFKPAIAINIKDLHDFQLNRDRTLSHFPNPDETDAQRKAREERNRKKNTLKSNAQRDTAIQTQIKHMRAQLQKRLDDAKKLTATDPKEAEDIKAMIKRFQNDLEQMEDALKAGQFIKNAHFEIVGDADTDGLHQKMIKAIDEDDSLKLMDRFRIQLQTYKMLDDVKSALELGLSKEDLNKLEATEEHQLLVKSITARDAALETFFTAATAVISQKLARFKSQMAEDSINDHYAVTLAHYKKQIKDLTSELETTEDPVIKKTLQRKIENAERAYKLAEEKKTELSVTPKQIKEELRQLPRDITVFSYWAISASSSSDKILSLFSKMTKFEFDRAEMESKRAAMNLQKAIDKFGGIEGTRKYLIGDNAESFYEHMLEEGEEWVNDPDPNNKGKILKKVNRLVSKYQDIEHIDANGKKRVMSYDNIIKDFKFNIGALRDEKMYKEARELQKRFEQWKDDNLHRDKHNKYYKLQDLFQDDIGKKAKELMDEYSEKISAFYDNIRDNTEDSMSEFFPKGRNKFHLSDDEIKQLDRLTSEKRQLSSKYDKYGNEKDPEDVEIAERIREYNTRFAELHSFDTDDLLFENVRAKAHKIYSSLENGQQLYEDWHSRNTVITTSDKFNNEYNRRRKERMIVKFSYNQNDNTMLDWMESFDTQYLDAEHWQEAFEAKLKEEDLLGDWENYYNEKDIDAQIRDLLKPYRIGMEVDISLMDDSTLDKLKELEQSKTDADHADFLVRKEQNIIDEDSKYRYLSFKEKMEEYNNRYNEYVRFVETPEYRARLKIEQDKVDAYNKKYNLTPATGKIYLRDSDWYKSNHYTRGVDEEGDTIYQPTRAWTKMIPEGATLDANGKLIKPVEGDSLEGLITVKPNSRYRSVNLKDEYVIDKEAGIKKGIFNEKGYPLPKLNTPELRNKWSNPKYEKLQNDPKIGPLFNTIVEEYHKAQQLIPHSHRLGNVIPFIQKGVRQTILNTTKGANKLEAAKSLMAEKFVIDHATDVEFENSSLNHIDNKYIPVHYTHHIDSDQVDKDVIGSIMKFIYSANRYDAANNMAADARTLVALVDRREDVSNKDGGTVKRMLGQKMFDTTYQKGGDEQVVRKADKGRAALLLEEFIEMQIFGELTKPTTVEIGGRVLSLDKIAGLITGMASVTQIGGITGLGLLKGGANALNAQAQQWIEAHAGEFYSKKAWADGVLRTKFNLKDRYQDMKSITNTSKSGQLMDVFDALQGSFKDEFGRNINGNQVTKMMGSAWYMNQYAGEHWAAMTSMNALLLSHKVIDGEVYNIQEYLKQKRDLKGSNLTIGEKNQHRKDFEDIKENLLDSIEINKETGLLGVKDGVNWVLGLDNETEIKKHGPIEYAKMLQRNQQLKARLHGVNKRLNGAYAEFDTVKLQRNFMGKVLIMYKKYLAPALRKRYQTGVKVDQELGTITEGFYVTMFKLLRRDIKGTMREAMATFIPQLRNDDYQLSEMEEHNLRRAAMELLTLGALVGILTAIAKGDDEDEDDISTARWIAIYEVTRLRRELGALIAVNPVAFKDNWRIINNPSAAVGYAGRWIDLMMQGGADVLYNVPFGEGMDRYKVGYGVAEKDDTKLFHSFRKAALGTIYPYVDINEQVKNMNR